MSTRLSVTRRLFGIAGRMPALHWALASELGAETAGPLPVPPSAHQRLLRRGQNAARQRARLLEMFRRLYLSVQSVDGASLVPAIGITSAHNGEGRTTLAAGMAAAMAADLDRPVVLIEVDLANPGLHRAIGVDPQPGICEYLRHECELPHALRQVSERLFVLPAGDARGEASRLTRQLAAADLRGRLDTSGALLVLDLPPILDASYGVLASSMADELLFVVRAGETLDEDLRKALTRLESSSVRTVVLNQARVQIPRWVRGLAE